MDGDVRGNPPRLIALASFFESKTTGLMFVVMITSNVAAE
jgi:hypothetical protein